MEKHYEPDNNNNNNVNQHGFLFTIILCCICLAPNSLRILKHYILFAERMNNTPCAFSAAAAAVVGGGVELFI